MSKEWMVLREELGGRVMLGLHDENSYRAEMRQSFITDRFALARAVWLLDAMVGV